MGSTSENWIHNPAPLHYTKSKHPITRIFQCTTRILSSRERSSGIVAMGKVFTSSGSANKNRRRNYLVPTIEHRITLGLSYPVNFIADHIGTLNLQIE